MIRSFSVALALGVVTISCAKDETPFTPPQVTVAPHLLVPQVGDTIPQNDPTIGCAFDSVGGYGFSVPFSWSPVPGATAYHLVLHHTGSQFPALDLVVTDTAFAYSFCNSYVIDANLHDWRWTVAGVSDTDADGPFAAEGSYEFEPMVFPPQP